MKLNNKLISLPLMLLTVPVFIFSCNNGGEPGPTPEKYKGLKFTAIRNYSSIGYAIYGSLPNIHIQYSTDDGVTWKNWTNTYCGSTDITYKSDQDITLNDGESVCIRNTNLALSANEDNYFYFTMTGEIEASGDVSSMINYGGLKEYCYCNMFLKCTSLITAPTLPATILKEGCYEAMFFKCENLAFAPTLPAIELVDFCYYKMFGYCENLKVNEGADGDLIFICPETIGVNSPVDDMFTKTGGEFIGTPEVDNIYYSSSGTPIPQEYTGLKLTSTLDGSTINYYAAGAIDTWSIRISFDDGEHWKAWPKGSKTINLDYGKDVCVKNINDILSIDEDNYFQFVMDGGIKASGDVSSMINNASLSKYCYLNLFNGCEDLTVAPTLPATTLVEHCYQGMFKDCVGLTSAPLLPATTLAKSCYQGMFKNCTNLSLLSTLPATTLADSCYQEMFSGCIALSTPPDLLATDLKDSCYQGMFKGCINLSIIPTLPATTLAKSCYQEMLSGCIALFTPPDLPATILKEGCYQEMFSGCTGLIYAPCLLADELMSRCYYKMFYNCSNLVVKEGEIPGGEKIFECPDTSDSFDSVSDMFNGTKGSFKGTPVSGKTYYKYTNALRFASTINGSSVGYTLNGSLSNVPVQYSLDDGFSWLDWSDGSQTIPLNEGECIYVRNTSNTLSIDTTSYFHFDVAGEIAASGNINSMINYSEISDYCFYQMFKDSGFLISAPELSATTLKEGCYQSMFEGCTALVTPPELPAIILAEACYKGMFYNCTSLESAPISLPAKKLAESCYDCMFYNCTSLIAPPTLPATGLEKSCYHKMFCSCSTLTSAPELPATVLKDYCYCGMFEDCESLKITDQNLDGIGVKIFKCPSIEDVQSPVYDMFDGTAGVFQDDPFSYITYYWYIG